MSELAGVFVYAYLLRGRTGTPGTTPLQSVAMGDIEGLATVPDDPVRCARVRTVLGHRDITATRKHYAPVLFSRLKQASERLARRFRGWQPPESDTSSEPDAVSVMTTPAGVTKLCGFAPDSL